MNSETVRHDTNWKVVKNSIPQMQWHCGYVRIPFGHALYGLRYHDHLPGQDLSNEPIGKRGILLAFTATGKWRVEDYFNVHGGLTFSEWMKKGGWWLGFDCNHLYDHINIQDADYVESECRSLVDQINELQVPLWFYLMRLPIQVFLWLLPKRWYYRWEARSRRQNLKKS